MRLPSYVDKNKKHLRAVRSLTMKHPPVRYSVKAFFLKKLKNHIATSLPVSIPIASSLRRRYIVNALRFQLGKMMALYKAFKSAHYYLYFSLFILIATLTVISCHSTKCRQNPCYLPSVSPSIVGIKSTRQHTSTSNDLNLIMNNHLTKSESSMQDDENKVLEASIKHKNIPNYMLKIYGQKSHKLDTGISYDNVRNYRAISGNNKIICTTFLF